MPVEFFHNPETSTRLGVWHISEEIDELEKSITLLPEQKERYGEMKNPSRKKQWLANMNLLAALTEKSSAGITWQKSGKPVFQNKHGYLSLSHSGDYATAIVSDTYPVGIDIEKISDRILRVKEQFLSLQEIEAIGSQYQKELFYLCWCAKESVYKLLDNRKIDFRTHMSIDIPELQPHGDFLLTVSYSGKSRKYLVHYFFRDPWVLTYACSR